MRIVGAALSKIYSFKERRGDMGKMHRRSVVDCTVCIAVLCMLVTILPATAAIGAGKLQPERIILNITETPDVSQSVTWRTEGKVTAPKAQIIPATGGTDLESKAVTVDAATEVISMLETSTKVYYHSVVFKELAPDTLYAYRVGSEDAWSEWNQFRTATQEFKPFSFVYLGDPQNDILSMCSRVFRAAYQQAPEAALWLLAGDIVNVGDDDSLWGEFYEGLGWIARMTPMVMVAGNHEYKKSPLGGGKKGLTFLWRPQFTLPANGPEGLEESAYYVDFQGVRFIILNGNEMLEEQAKWIKKVLKDNPQRWTIVSIHQPFYSTAEDRDNPYHRMLFTKTFDKYKVDLVLQGHDHTYGRTYRVYKNARSEDKGPVYVVSVTGPKQYDSSDLYKDIMAKTGSDTQLYQVIKVEKNKLVYEAYDAAGELFDSFELTKE